MRGFLLLLLIIGIGACTQQVTQQVSKGEEEKKPNITSFITFSSPEDFREYYLKGQSAEAEVVVPTFAVREEFALPDAAEAIPVEKASSPKPQLMEVERYSKTNVQVAGIDEPDIVKTDGRQIYYSLYAARYFIPEVRTEILPRITMKTKIISVFPPENLSEISELEEGGELLLANATLVVFSRTNIAGYNVSNPSKPEKLWSFRLNNTALAAARLYRGDVFLVLRSTVNYGMPCPIEPLSGTAPFRVECSEIYHPRYPLPVEAVYTVVKLNPQTGEVENSTSFTGTYFTVVYMSESGIYITYPVRKDNFEIFSKFIRENQDIFPEWLIDRIDKLESYDLSSRAKSVELQYLLNRFLGELSADEMLRMRNEISSRFNEFGKKHAREFETTEIIRLSPENLEILATGKVPGRLLNQFSLDEYQGYLRLATTLDRMWIMGYSTGEMENDLYVLNTNLEIVGEIQGFGRTERIYSVRFIGERGYIVTFRQTDPFFVVDLSNPEKPELKGELKIPGYSSYLHPLGDNLILGIGKEGGQVKLSLFDVSSASQPEEVSRYMLKEYWSDVLRTHHAFMQDAKHKIFFVPGARGGYIFSYSGNSLEMVRAVSGIRARRALYINSYLYILGDGRIVVLRYSDWKQVAELTF